MMILQLVLNGTVHCRTGSLEMLNGHKRSEQDVHCRTGSLEMKIFLSAIPL